jgi:hypothetical protein
LYLLLFFAKHAKNRGFVLHFESGTLVVLGAFKI